MTGACTDPGRLLHTVKSVSKGMYGSVYRGCIDSGCNTTIALKVTKDPTAKMEYTIAKKLKGFGVPDMYFTKSCTDEDLLYFEFVDGEDMRTFFKKERSFEEIRSIMAQVLHNLHRIQAKYPSFRHHDLHPRNILIKTVPERRISILDYTISNAGLEPVIIDFGYAVMDGVKNPMVNSKRHESRGIVRNSSKMYDVHFFLNVVFQLTRRKSSNGEIRTNAYLKTLLPKAYRTCQSKYTNQYRLRSRRDPTIPSITTILGTSFFTNDIPPPMPRIRPSIFTRLMDFFMYYFFILLF